MSTTTLDWLPVPTHSGYFANAAGQILGPSGNVLRPMPQPGSGHLYVLTPLPRRPRKLFVHRAVLLAHIGPPSDLGMECRHLDGDPANNALTNLAWGTRAENMHDKIRHGTERHGEEKANARLTAAQVHAIRLDARSSRSVAVDYGVSHTTILGIRRGRTWMGI